MFATVDSRIALSFLERYPCRATRAGSASDGSRPSSPATDTAVDARPAELLERLRRAPKGRAGELEAEARRGIVLALVAALQPLVAHIADLEREIAHALRCHPDGQIFRSLFRDPKSVICAASLLAELGDSRLRYPSAEALAADGGMCAVAIESGKRKHAAFRWACDKRLRNALATLANTSRHHNAWAGDPYAKRSRPRTLPPARDPHPRTRLEPRPLAHLAGPPALRPRHRHRALQRKLALQG